MIGTTLSHFKITAKLGEGGMGEVYRAEDTRLGREVAIKVLPEAVATDSERLARFEREAKVLASLNHPNIAAIYEVGAQDTVHFLVMEQVEGSTLADRLRAGPIGLDETLKVALQLAAALEAAHQRGVVHRDLKPANIMLTAEGQSKVLDFGLAKILEPADESGTAQSSQMPTAADDRTRAGTLMGTTAYMSPEQARGQSVDRRTDAWAFGCVLYEMLTGKRAFAGETTTDVLAAVVGGEPDWAALPAATPRAVRRLLRRTLAKDSAARLRDLGDARLDLMDALSPSAQNPPIPTAGHPTSRRWLGLAIGLAAGLALGAVFASQFGKSADSEVRALRPAIRGIVELPRDANLAYGASVIGFDNPMLTLSPDGRWLVYVGRDGTGSRLYRHDLTGFEEAEPIAGTEGALYAFFAPDGKTVGFATRDRLRRVSLEGDDLQTLTEVRAVTRASWLADGSIVFAEIEGRRIMRIPTDGGTREELPAGAGSGFMMSDVLPDGKRLLASNRNKGLSGDYGDVLLVDLETGKQKVILELGYDAKYIQK